MCVPREALVSALVLRVAREQYRVRDDEIASLRALGCTPEALRAAFATLPASEAREHAIARVEAVGTARS